MIGVATDTVILASASAARTRMLSQAGVDHSVRPADIDETSIQNDVDLSPRKRALALAKAKALAVSRHAPEAYVIGADQILALDDEILTKPGSPDGVRAQLERLRGKSHQLISAVAVAQNDEVLWAHADVATLMMRVFSDDFIADYVARVGEDVAASVGGYHLEGLGAQLFDSVDGDHFTVMGMPLIPLLKFLRTQGVLRL